MNSLYTYIYIKLYGLSEKMILIKGSKTKEFRDPLNDISFSIPSTLSLSFSRTHDTRTHTSVASCFVRPIDFRKFLPLQCKEFCRKDHVTSRHELQKSRDISPRPLVSFFFRMPSIHTLIK